MFAHEPKPWDFSDEITRLTNIYLHLSGIPMHRDQNTAELLRHEREQARLEKEAELMVPDFTSDDDLIQAGIIREHRPAVKELMALLALGKQARQEDLLKACSMLEKCLYYTWRDEA